MRTTLNIEKEAISLIKKYADEREISLGQATSDLVHLGAKSLPQFKMKNGWVVFDLPAGESPLTNKKLDEWEKVEQVEEHRLAFSGNKSNTGFDTYGKMPYC